MGPIDKMTLFWGWASAYERNFFFFFFFLIDEFCWGGGIFCFFLILDFFCVSYAGACSGQQILNVLGWDGGDDCVSRK